MSDELDFIDKLRRLATHPAARGFADDAAVLELGGTTLVLTHDMMVEGVHFLPNHDLADTAWKLVAVNLSDLAAKGAKPVGVLLGYMLGDNDERFLQGLAAVLDAYDVPLLGGDSVSGGPPQSLGLTAIGEATHNPVPSRSGAQVSDALYVTGSVGGAMMGFEALRDGGEADTSAYLRPTPLLAEGRALAPLVTAMMDISDGLLLDASRLADASGIMLAIDSAAVPIAAPESRRDDAMRWGDDYQLLFTAPAGAALPIEAYLIGEVRPRDGAALLIDGSAPSAERPLGYQHS